jgi:hypothetical protein
LAALTGLYGATNRDSSVGEFMFGRPQQPVGYTGGIPEYNVARSLAPNAFATTTPTGEPRRPGSGGRRYFTDTTYTPTGKTMAGATPSQGVYNTLTATQANELFSNLFGTGGLGGEDTEGLGTANANVAGTNIANTGTANANVAGTNIANTPVLKSKTPTTKYTDAQVKGTLDTLIAQNPNRGEGLYRAVGEQIKSEIGKGGVTLESAAKQLASLMPEFSEQEIIAKYKQMGFAQGGLASLPQSRGYYLGGATDGMADRIPATIENTEPAALSDGEFVIPADVVSHLGNGNSDAGAKQLYAMMDRIRQARTGRKEQGRNINPNKYLPT